MGNLFNALNGLKTNIFGGGNTGPNYTYNKKNILSINEEKLLAVLSRL